LNSRRVRERLVSSPLILLVTYPRRAFLVLKAVWRVFAIGVKWLVASREHTNFTYDLTERNRRQLAWFVANLLDRSVVEVTSYFDELETDREFADALSSALAASPRSYVGDSEPRFARRIAWYAIVRILRPRVIVETGVDKGLGSMAIAAALSRNAADGVVGRLLAIDINAGAGVLVVAPWADYVEIVVGDSLVFLKALETEVDIFLHDSNHAYQHEFAELSIVFDRLADHGVMISDAASDSDALDDFARLHGLRYSYIGEELRNSWMRGQGLGIVRR